MSSICVRLIEIIKLRPPRYYDLPTPMYPYTPPPLSFPPPARPVGKSIGSVHRQVLWRHVTFQVVRGMLMNRSYVYSTTSMTYQLLPGSTDFPACNAQDGVDVTRSRISMTALQRTHSNQLHNPHVLVQSTLRFP